MTISLSESLGGGSPAVWAQDFLIAAGFPVTPDNVQAIYSWEFAESGGGGGMWNPLNTTQGGYAGETDFNSVGVKNYATRADGLAANAKVIHNGYYPMVVAWLRFGDCASCVTRAVTASPWGTGWIDLIPVEGAPTPPPPPPPPKPKVPPMYDPALPIVAALANPQGGAWMAQENGVVYFVNNGGATVTGGMVSPADVAAFAGRKVAKLEPRRYGHLGIHHGYTIVAQSGEKYVPEGQH